ncbi:hypothetical protein [Atlantibacter hermannii]|uniref:hypothetical protein n=1 Tax=Atlantibacter hermannii TaxID=565 RepID=UPI001C7038D1|nr:hypothetical protein [Atlantibacter hermannii]MBW9429367.1 hypothetical protein [Atlantibacter hermannii]
MNRSACTSVYKVISGLVFLLSFSLHAATLEEMRWLHTADIVGSTTVCRAVLSADEGRKTPAMILNMTGRATEQTELTGKYDSELSYSLEHAESPFLTYHYTISVSLSDGHEHAEIDPDSIVVSLPSARDRELALAAEMRKHAVFDQKLRYIEITEFPSYLIRPEPGVSPINMGVTYCRKLK